MKRLLIGLLAFQILAVVVLLCVPFGFDHRSSFGLDINHFVLLSVAYLATLITGVGVAVTSRRYWLAVGQLAVPAAVVLLVVAGIIRI